MTANAYFYIGEGDTVPSIEAVLLDEDNEAVNLTSATVLFRFASLGGTQIFSRSATVVTAADGRVEYEWQAGDTDTPGRYLGAFQVTYATTDIQTFPNNRYIEIVIQPSL